MIYSGNTFTSNVTKDSSIVIPYSQYPQLLIIDNNVWSGFNCTDAIVSAMFYDSLSTNYLKKFLIVKCLFQITLELPIINFTIICVKQQC